MDLAEGTVIEGVEIDGLHGTEGIEPDLDLVAAKPGIDGIEEALDPDIGEDLVDGTDFLEEEVRSDPGEVDWSQCRKAGVVTILRGLKNLAVDSGVIADGQPGREGAIELVDVERWACPDLGLELRLNGLEKSFDEAAGVNSQLHP